jgi:hypothetical protein
MTVAAPTRRWTWLVRTLTATAVLLVVAGVTVAAAGHLERGAELVLSGAALSMFAAAATTMTRMPHLHVEPDGEDLVIRFGGWDRLWTLRRQTRIRTADLTKVGTVPMAALHPSAWSWRLRGTMIPGVIRAGTFIDAQGRQLWDVRATGDALLVELGPDAPYRRMVLQVPAPTETARRLRPLLPRYVTPTDRPRRGRSLVGATQRRTHA